jgi:ABC-type phosphate/phosphonate transport system substrate-binding protein
MRVYDRHSEGAGCLAADSDLIQGDLSRRAFMSLALGILPVLTGSTVHAQQKQQVASFHIAFSAGLFADVNPTDAMAAAKVWSNALGRKRGYTITDPIVFDDAGAAIDALRSQRVDIATILTVEYLEIKDKVAVVPQFVPKRRGRIQQDLLLLVHNQSGINHIDDLAEREILMLAGMEGSMGKTWLENILMEKGFSSIDRFFRRAGTVQKASRAVLPVYFKQADACLVTRDGFETMIDLNPQLKTQLKILMASPAFMPALVCTRGDYDSPYRQSALDAVRDLPKEPGGQQLLMLFKIDELVLFEPSYLDSARQLITQNVRLKEQLRRKGVIRNGVN